MAFSMIVAESLMSRHAGWASAINSSSNELIHVKSASAFTVLWSGVATPGQARRMIFDYLFNPRHFWSPFPISTLARSERWYTQDWLPADLGCNWRAKTWIRINYMIIHGLKRYGYQELASLVVHHTYDLVKYSGDREYYDAETGEGCGLDPFWGWSLLGYFLIYEDQQEGDITRIPDLE
jgi:putative isomerase